MCDTQRVFLTLPLHDSRLFLNRSFWSWKSLRIFPDANEGIFPTHNNQQPQKFRSLTKWNNKTEGKNARERNFLSILKRNLFEYFGRNRIHCKLPMVTKKENKQSAHVMCVCVRSGSRSCTTKKKKEKKHIEIEYSPSRWWSDTRASFARNPPNEHRISASVKFNYTFFASTKSDKEYDIFSDRNSNGSNLNRQWWVWRCHIECA